MQLQMYFAGYIVCCHSVSRVLWIFARVPLCSCISILWFNSVLIVTQLGCCGWLSGCCCYAVACVYWRSVVCCHSVSWVFWMVVWALLCSCICLVWVNSVLPCSFWGVGDCCQGVAMQLHVCSVGLVCSHSVAMELWIVARVMLCSCMCVLQV